MDKGECILQITNYINGQWLDPSGMECFQTINPHSKAILEQIGESTIDDMKAAIDAANAASEGWKHMPSPKRGHYLIEAAKWLADHLEEIAYDLTREIGKTIGEAKGEVNRSIQTLYYYAAEGLQPIGEVIPSSNENILIYTKREPIGPVGLITPWNFPIAIPTWKLAPALIYGNTVVLKPSEYAPKSAYYLMKALDHARIPAGVVNCVFGTQVDIGKTLVDSEKIKGISFTGSTEVGKIIGVQAASKGKKVQLEMGGKNAIVVLKDANLQKAVDSIITDAYSAAGQKCTAASRILIEAEVYNQVKNMLKERTEEIAIGDPHKEGTLLGPVATEKQYDLVQQKMENGKATMNLVIEKNIEMQEGYYIKPTIFETKDPVSELIDQEIFGPVITLLEINNMNEAIKEVNRSKYGLSASIFTTNLENAQRFIQHVDVGMVHINTGTVFTELQAPFGGMKDSSYGPKEQGKEAIEFYTMSKTIYQSI